MIFLSGIGNYGLVWLVIAAGLLISKKHRRWGFVLLCALAVTTLAGEFVIKNIVCRPRPFVANNTLSLLIPEPSGFSFPSVHSAAAFCAATVLWKVNRRAGGVSFVLAALIAFSRMYLYVHFPTDVLAGVVLGVVCALLTVRVFSWRGKIASLS